MATFTMELREVMELEGDTGNGARIGLDRYPIFDEDYRDPLNRLIIDHFLNREIGQETVSMFKHALSRRMNEIMPYFNQLYLSERIKFDPLSTFDLKTMRDDTTEENAKQDSKNDGTATSTTGGRTINSTFPQSQLAGDEDYASDGSDVNSGATTTNGSTGNTTTEGKTTANGSSTTTGYQGSAAALLQQLRASYLNINMLVIDQLTDCFMLVWDSGEEMLPSHYSIGWLY